MPASDMADPLRSADLKPVDILVREAIQNSLDERRKDTEGPVRVRFERRVAFGEEKSRIVDNLDLCELVERRKRFKSSHGWFSKGNETLDRIENPDIGFPVLLVSDFNTNGLGGRWNRRGSRNDRFFNLVLSIGGSLKWDEDRNDDQSIHSLGSYGYGKMAFAITSNIRSMIYYSTFRPDGSTGESSCRAMASGFLPPHSDDDIHYAGQAYFGEESDEDRNPRMPLVDTAAHGWIEDLGLPVRSNDDTGTTVIILAAESKMPDIVSSCEKWWWPRMWDPDPVRRVEFEFIDENTQELYCNPLSHSELNPFIDCFKLLATRGKAGEKYHIRDVKVNPPNIGMRAAGQIGLKALDVSDDRKDDDLANRIALVRDGLVISYDGSFAHEDKPPVAGVFAPDATLDTMQAFVFSEPPAHDKWEERSDRLRVKYPWGGDFIRLTKQRIKLETRDFQTRQMAEPEVEHTNAADFLKNTLAPLFRIRGPNPPSPPRSRQRAFTITTSESGRRRNGVHHEDFATYRIGLSDHVAVESVMADATFTLRALADVDGSPRDIIPCMVTAPGRIRESEAGTTLSIELRRGEEIEATASASVHPRWKTRWDIAIVRQDA